MDNCKADVGQMDERADGSRDHLLAELSDEELSKVSGGRSGVRLALLCATGVHIKKAQISC